MKQQFIGLQHCKCGMSWKHDIGFFERTSDMVFCLGQRHVNVRLKPQATVHCKEISDDIERTT